MGVREIAEAAGVTAMLVNRYFGSKEQLFAKAVDTAFAPRTVVGEQPGSLARDTAVTLAARTAQGAEHLGPFLLMLRSVSDPRAAEIVRAATESGGAADQAAVDAGGRAADVRDAGAGELAGQRGGEVRPEDESAVVDSCGMVLQRLLGVGGRVGVWPSVRTCRLTRQAWWSRLGRGWVRNLDTTLFWT